MDPDEAHRRLCELAAESGGELTAQRAQEIAAEQGELFAALDHWLVSGGFPPEQWGGTR